MRKRIKCNANWARTLLLTGKSSGHADVANRGDVMAACAIRSNLGVDARTGSPSWRRPTVPEASFRSRGYSTGGVPWVWKDSIVFRPQAWPFLRSSSVQTIGFQSGARMRRAPALATSTRLPPGSQT